MGVRVWRDFGLPGVSGLAGLGASGSMSMQVVGKRSERE